MANSKPAFSAQSGKLRTAVYAVIPFFTVAAIVAAWYISSANGNSKIFPNPTQVVQRMLKLFTDPVAGTSLFGHIGISLLRAFKGLLISRVVGIPLGILIGWNNTFASTVGMLFELIRPIPPLAWIPLLVMWFGISESSKVAMVVLGAIIPVVVNSYTAVRLVPELYIQVGRMFNAATNYQILKKVVLPASLPTIFAGIRNSTSVAFMCVLAAEMLAADSGLGFLITRGMNAFDVPLIMCGMVLIGLIGALISVITNFIERKLCPWNTSIK